MRTFMLLLLLLGKAYMAGKGKKRFSYVVNLLFIFFPSFSPFTYCPVWSDPRQMDLRGIKVGGSLPLWLFFLVYLGCTGCVV